MTKTERKRRNIVIERYKSVFEQLTDSKRKEIPDNISSGKFYSLKELEKVDDLTKVNQNLERKREEKVCKRKLDQ